VAAAGRQHLPGGREGSVVIDLDRVEGCLVIVEDADVDDLSAGDEHASVAQQRGGVAHPPPGEIARCAEAVRGWIENLARALSAAAADEDAAVLAPRGGKAGMAVEHRARLRESAVLVELPAAIGAPAAAGDENTAVGEEDGLGRPARNRHRADAGKGDPEDDKGCGEVHGIGDTELRSRTPFSS